MICFDGVYLKILRSASGTKYRYFHWAKRSTAWRAVMAHSAAVSGHCVAGVLQRAKFDFWQFAAQAEI